MAAMVGNELLLQFSSRHLESRKVVAAGWCKKPPRWVAAYAAGLAVGFYRSLEELRGKWKSDRVWRPEMAQA